MLRANPLLSGVARGLLRPGAAQLAYLNCLMLQAAALIIWWPKSNLAQSLANQQGPQPLMATMAAVGLSVAYFSMRAGAEEFLLAGQQSLHEWVAGTSLTVRRMVSGGIYGHWLQTLYALLLSSPFICLAHSVDGGSWSAMSASVATVFVQATFYWLVGAVTYVAMGEHGQSTFMTARTLLFGVYVLSAILLPSASHVMVSIELLGGDGFALETRSGLPALLEFFLMYSASATLLAIVLIMQLQRLRQNKAGGETTAAD